MNEKQSLFQNLVLAKRVVNYTMKIIFANKFRYFIMAALGLFVIHTALIIFNAASRPDDAMVFWVLLMPGILIVFYPTSFGIQNDVDTRMLEILFGIPNYRYKVWLTRLVIIYAISAGIIFLFSLLGSWSLTTIPVFEMTFQLLFPVVFFGSLAFLVSTIVRSGSGTAVVMVILAMASWLSRDFFSSHRLWDVFLNPFDMPDTVNIEVWSDIVLKNRAVIVFGIVVAITGALLNLQKREKFLG